jgi:hypothetical protein
MPTDPLTEVLLALSEPSVRDTVDQAQRVRVLLAEHDLDDAAAIPGWLMDMLAAVRDGCITDWVDFERGDETDVFALIRDLPKVLPVHFEDNEESKLLSFAQRKLDACVSVEASSWKVSPAGETWV